MSGWRAALRRWLAEPKPAAAGTAADAARGGADRPPRDHTARALRSLQHELHEIRGLLHQQGELTTEALRKAGWQSDVEALQQRALGRALSLVHAKGDVIVGPWTGEVGFELLYWIPFLNWLVERGLDPSRMIVISRGGAAPWYRHLTTRYVDLLDLISPDEFREETAGPKKQVDRERDFDQRMIATVRQQQQLSGNVPVLHPAAMFRLFAGVWRRRMPVDLVETFTHFRPLATPEPFAPGERPAGLPPQYILAKFYFSKAFPDSFTNRRRVTELLRTVSAQAPVALVSTSLRVDEHVDYQVAGNSGLYVIDAHTVPARNLELQTRLVAGARGFVGTYGGFSYLAPFLGVRSLSFFSRRAGFEAHHLELAHRIFDRMVPGGFLALECSALDLVQPAVRHWLETPVHAGRQPVPRATAADVVT
jgi:hypothetical protein